MSLMHEFAAKANIGESKAHPHYIELPESLFQFEQPSLGKLSLSGYINASKNVQYRELGQFLGTVQKGHDQGRLIFAGCAFEVEKVARELKTGSYELIYLKRRLYTPPSSKAGHPVNMAFFSYSGQSRTIIFTGFLRSRLGYFGSYSKCLSKTDLYDSGILVYSKKLELPVPIDGLTEAI